MQQQIRYQGGGTIYYDPPQDTQADPSPIPKVTIYSLGGALLVAEQTATLDPVSTTVADVGAGSELITVASAIGISIGRQYLLASGFGHREWVRPASISGTAVILHEPLRHSYAAADTLHGCRLSVAILAAQATPLGLIEARWSYAARGVTQIATTMVEIVRYPWPETVMAPWEFARLVPSLSGPEYELVSRRGLAFHDEIVVATEEVRADLVQRGLRPDLFLSAEEFKRPIALRVLYAWAWAGHFIPTEATHEEWMASRLEAYEQALDRAIAGTRSYDADESGHVDDSEATAADLAYTRIVL